MTLESKNTKCLVTELFNEFKRSWVTATINDNKRMTTYSGTTTVFSRSNCFAETFKMRKLFGNFRCQFLYKEMYDFLMVLSMNLYVWFGSVTPCWLHNTSRRRRAPIARRHFRINSQTYQDRYWQDIACSFQYCNYTTTNKQWYQAGWPHGA